MQNNNSTVKVRHALEFGKKWMDNELRTRQHKHICRKSEPWGGLLQK
jgi:hypothetical protein